MPQRYFITGTDTEIGKTTIAAGLLHAARQRGLTTAAVKPVAAGCEVTPEGLRNDDALALQAECSPPLDYAALNPVALAPPIAPHIAAREAGLQLSASRLADACFRVFERGADLTLVEGAGGWRVPLNDDQTLADLAQELGEPVILVVGLRLGCINHALLTAEAIAADGLRLAGWVANQVDPQMDRQQHNLETLKAMLSAPCLGVVPRVKGGRPAEIAKYLALDTLLEPTAGLSS
ncbi:dethiobiotin synthase [Halopseudomonas bauzanensis]|uniref:ATP-dependent dethiobiotin synthetase BioD n=1 Tax=Halopseudomonas bauzanensis TaxID=653930 RepID=A0A031M5N0_9GAMM|nr:dethiobiotin synthase [Halopseudomonas bauzanensis]EZQ15917.1 dethiobiotin synthetase [Halopseudomonas bauzanensis]SES32921.1 dethiobiotin synthetase [Halopseudomonas bauzanensis]SFM32967.1 dethiobiotin synthetase [Halopseudomonas bauzanensis]